MIVYEPFNRRFEKTESVATVVEDKLARQQTASPPAGDGLRRDVESLGQLFGAVDLLALLARRRDEFAAEPGDEQLEVVTQFPALDELVVDIALGMETGDVKGDEIEGVLLCLVDQRIELLGGLEFTSLLVLRREPKLHQQLGQAGILDASHGRSFLFRLAKCLFYRPWGQKKRTERIALSLESSSCCRVRPGLSRRALAGCVRQPGACRCRPPRPRPGRSPGRRSSRRSSASPERRRP